MINFTKMEGLGNDYVYIDCTNKNKQEIEHISSLAKKISDRHFGVGSDGIILICKSKIADFKMIMFNQDGTQAEMCGNGIRCVGKFVYDKKLTQKENITVETLAGIKQLDFYIEKNKVKYVTVNMGEPILQPEKIPVKLDNPNKLNKIKIKTSDKEFEFTCVSMGNPHAITIVDNVDKFDVEKYGRILEIDEHFPKKANIEFIEILNENTIKMRVWERGAGETLACGTGACAVVVASTLNNYIKPKQETTVKLLGGDLIIKWDKNVFMKGPATIVFEGRYND